MNKLEKYLIIKDAEIKADDEYISDGLILVNKFFIQNKVLKNYKNCDFNIMERFKIPYEKGVEWELPDCANLLPYGGFEFVLNNNYGFSYELLKLFMNSFLLPDYSFFISTYGEEKTPLLKIFCDDDLFVGVIMPIEKKQINGKFIK